MMTKDSEDIFGQWKLSDLKLLSAIPPHSPYGVSFYLPEWSNIQSIVNEDREFFSKIVYGYPRIIIHDFIRKINQVLLESLQLTDVKLFSFPSTKVVQECQKFIVKYAETEEQKSSLNCIRLEAFKLPNINQDEQSPVINLIIFPACFEMLVVGFWQMTGEIISCRFAAHCLRLMGHDNLVAATNSDKKYACGDKSDSNYTVNLEQGNTRTEKDQMTEQETKLKIRETIVKMISVGERVTQFPSTNDVYLFPTGMSPIYNALKLSLSTCGEYKSVCFGFPFKDTKKLLGSFGPGLHFLGNGEQNDLETLEMILQTEKISMVFLEFPSNPLLKSSDLLKLRQLADQHNFILVLDDTLGNMINLQDQLIADIVVTSLTKIFSGYSDVMGGSLIISPHSSRYSELKSEFDKIYEDNLWCEDAATLELNSRDVVERAKKANLNTEQLADCLKDHPLVKRIYFPKYTTPELYKTFQRPQGGYGSLFSLEFHSPELANQFYDQLPIAKGPSLGTNFTIALPYIKLAYHKEILEVAQFGCYDHFIRVSVGLEDINYLREVFLNTLKKLS